TFYDEDSLFARNAEAHNRNERVFKKALDLNAKERSRRFESIDTHSSAEKIHEHILRRSVSLFEPRPELNHATNTLCIVGHRDTLTKNLFLDRRAFMNSYDYSIDPEGKLLFGIMKPLPPVCGGINLEYFFSRVDNQKLGAGTKLPHNVMGLFGVANGTDGDLRPGLPSQMIEVHDPIRLMIIVEHEPEVVLKTIQILPETYEWFINEWVRLVVIHPVTKELSLFRNGGYVNYEPLLKKVEAVPDVTPLIESTQDNLHVYEIK
ncbi:MAG: putative inorganic carbon transporter subunit DabA, partial [Bacteroidia bacterium]